jgi:hypothetical protein
MPQLPRIRFPIKTRGTCKNGLESNRRDTKGFHRAYEILRVTVEIGIKEHVVERKMATRLQYTQRFLYDVPLVACRRDLVKHEVADDVVEGLVGERQRVG